MAKNPAGSDQTNGTAKAAPPEPGPPPRMREKYLRDAVPALQRPLGEDA